MVTCSAEFLEQLVLVGIETGLLSILLVAVATPMVVMVCAAVLVNGAASSKSAKAITYIAAIIA